MSSWWQYWTAASLAVGLGISSSFAWGPVTDVAIVTTGVRVLSQSEAIPLGNLDRYVREGAQAASERTEELYSNFDVDPLGTIESEMALLETVREGRVGPYFAYRLGGLGTLVASITAPLANQSPSVRQAYYADVDQAVRRAEMQLGRRQLVDPVTYLPTQMQAARAQDDTIVLEYQSGLGFDGLAQSNMSSDLSRSVNAVADVWYTIMSGEAALANVARSVIRDYLVNAAGFYVSRGNLIEAQAAYDRLVDRGLATPEVEKQIADMYYEGDNFDRAMTLYEKVLSEQPGRRDVMERMAQYFESVGDEALEEGELEDARDAYLSALDADKLHPRAQEKLLRVEKQIDVRDMQLGEAKDALASAKDAEAEAESAALNQNFAEAINLLREAEGQYMQVPGKFVEQATQAQTGLTRVSVRMRELKNRLIQNAQNLSGSGFGFNARRLADYTEDVSEQALRQLIANEYRSSIRGLRDEMEPVLAPSP